MSKRSIWKIAEWVLFVMWCGFILWMTLFSRKPLNSRIFNADLFYEIKTWLTSSAEGRYFINLFIKNILLFIPFGFLLPWKKNWKQVLITGCCVSTLIEIIQYVTMRGECEIDDVIANTFGAVIGYFLFKALTIIYRRIKGEN